MVFLAGVSGVKKDKMPQCAAKPSKVLLCTEKSSSPFTKNAPNDLFMQYNYLFESQTQTRLNQVDVLTIFGQEQSLHLTISVFMYESMISKHHGIFWNLQDLLSICLERGDMPVHFANRTASEGFMVTEKRAKLFCTSNFRNTVH